MHKNFALVAVTMVIALFSLTAMAGKDLTDMTKPNLGAVRSADDSLNVVGGWHERSYWAQASSGTCIDTGGISHPFVNYSPNCQPGAIIYNTVVKTEKTQVFGVAGQVSTRIDGVSYSQGYTQYQHITSNASKIGCPQDTAAMRFDDGFRRDNGVLIPGPAVICAKAR